MFGNECLEGVMYEATTAAILMAGLFMSFLVEYIGYRFVKSRAKKAAAAQSMQGTVMSVQSVRSLELVSVYIMEAGVIFHSMSKPLFPTTPPNVKHHMLINSQSSASPSS
jgi:zinc transporter 1/2/3